MFQIRLRQKGRPLIRLRYADEWTGLLVLVSVILFIAAVIEAGVLSDWLEPPARLQVTLPKSGVGGLTVGADVQLLGAHAGTVRRIRLNPSGEMYAVVDLDPQIEPFIRRDSIAVIRKQFVVAGASYLDLTRGSGEKMDWNYAVISAVPETSIVDTINKTFKDIHDEIMPMLANARDITAQIDGLLKDIRAGKGSVGQLMTNDALIRQAEATVVSLNEVVSKLKPVEDQVGGILHKADGTMANVQSVTTDVKKATPHLPAIAKSMDQSMNDLPALLAQAQTSLYTLQKLTNQLRSLWILGGSSSGKGDHRRLPPSEVRP
ncbi:MlaD family protein [Acetobacter sp. AN02]|uniref:MlaD family protein n=1 Tax=Acetobacter sp. AN02 TaxID=2894186 RepID=UPI00243421CD|nr:MlaD family protein [Acetobacter sp. AN02]MDG6094664.1 MlaD family protein [Acetobacter sp. AN02]